MILSAGKEEKVKAAVNHMRHAIIGVGFILCVLFIFPILMNLVGLPYGDYAKPSQVFSTISEISGFLFGSQIDPSFPGTNDSDIIPSDFSNI